MKEPKLFCLEYHFNGLTLMIFPRDTVNPPDWGCYYTRPEFGLNDVKVHEGFTTQEEALAFITDRSREYLDELSRESQSKDLDDD